LVAAAFVGTIAVAAFFLWHWTGGKVYRTAGGERRRIILEDGSLVFLNERSEIRVSFSSDRRNVRLHGNGIFDVTHDARRPMSVSTANAEIRALGTEFDVLQGNGPTRVAVIEGSVQVEPISDGIGPLTLVAHEVAEVDGQKVFKEDSADVEKITSWHGEELVLRNQPLSAVVEKFNGNNRRQLRIADPAAGQERISGRFKTDHPEALMRVLQDQDLHPGITIWETDDGWIVEAPKR
jgi:transmembrane sensor